MVCGNCQNGDNLEKKVESKGCKGHCGCGKHDHKKEEPVKTSEDYMKSGEYLYFMIRNKYF